MKKQLFATVVSSFLCLIFSLSLTASNAKYKVVNQNSAEQSTSIPTYVEYATANLPHVSELEALFAKYWENPGVFGFYKVGEEVDQLGYIHYRYKQTYQGVPIEFAELIVHTKDNKIYSWNGKLIDEEPANSTNGLEAEKALDFALKYIGASSYKWELEEEESFLKREQNDPEATFYPEAKLRYISRSISIDAQSLELAYQFKVYAHEPESHTEIYVSASSGAVLFTNSLIHTINVKGKATTGYSGVQTINTDSLSPAQFRLRQTVHGNGINTYDLNSSTSFASAVDFTDSDNDWNNVNAELDEYATDAHWGAEMTYVYLDSSFGRNSINDNGFTLNSYVHFDNNLSNASWDGSRMRYGDGNGTTTTPFTALDIAGHEIAHGLTNFTANLVYASEQGALNESFSDIFGAAIEFFARPGRADWLIGEDIGRTIRSMSNPNDYGDPDTRGGTNWINVIGCVPNRFTNNNCGVHTNSGVQNFWFYLLSEGGSGTNDNGDSYDVTGIGIDSAAAIAYRNLVVYLTRTSDYDDARFYSIQAAIDLFGPCSQQVESVKDAWHAVGIGKAYVDGVNANFYTSDSLACSFPHRVDFVDESNNGIDYKWYFGDGDSSTLRNPTHVYQDTGVYNVTLMIDGGSCGSDTLTKSSFIDIDVDNECEIILNDGTNPLQTDCTGKIYDSGGGNGDYSVNEDATITISPIGASRVSLDFIEFDVEGGRTGCDRDYVEVFDGPSINSPSLGVFCSGPRGNTTDSITSTFGSITIQFISNETTNQAGFEIDWKCIYPTTPPNSNFSISTDTTCNGLVSFTDLSTEVPEAWQWDFGDGYLSTEQNPAHIYEENGDYDVELITTNAFGSDTLLRKALIHVEKPPLPVVKGDSGCYGEDLTLQASSTGENRWYRQEIGGSYFSSADSITLGGLTADSSLWVENVILDPAQNIGPLDSSIGTGVYFNNQLQYLIFDVIKPIKLLSVKVHSGNSGARRIQLRNSNGNTLETATINIPAGESRVELNFEIDPGNNYQLGLSTTSNSPNLWRNSSGTNYPYEIDELVSITRSSANINGGLNHYYFFYDWEVLGLEGCASNREKVTARVNAASSPEVMYDTVCYKGFATVRALGEGEYRWYDSEDGENIISNLDSLSTDTLKSDTSFWVERIDGNNCASPRVEVFARVDSSCTAFVGIVENTVGSNEILIYPNPANYSFVVDFKELGNADNIEILDFTGKLIFNKDVSNKKGKVTINTVDISNGIYFVKIQTKENTFIRKINIRH